MKRPATLVISGLAFALAGSCAGSAAADIVDVGYFYNSGPGQIYYEGAFADHIQSNYINDLYTQITIDLSGLLASIDADGFRAVSVIDTGENSYGSAPGADIDLFALREITGDVTFDYDGPTETHQNETAEELAARVNLLDWGTGQGRGLNEGTFVSLGENGSLTAVLSETQFINGQNNGGNGFNDNSILLELSEVGSIERFRITIETVTVPAPGAVALLGVAGLAATRRRRK